ncbi:galactitol-1-phosphate 5-dehydrogenase [Oceanobacillus jeddahense]|uniref:Galactitol-1-phosphate 5-dehydrogenase n=1 Tax=Oceanobacillus jeddahense TaxID=1462527 RepID=A0ABY5JT09_9BACI|nr:galactitol-1-phosphate 5-dehydrogenase [Oceanobacillus jeddahense]UUI02017.1 galactitol-1-phosphate 5-dehydrogenase [Oceanobacillus jeddahense]
MKAVQMFAVKDLRVNEVEKPAPQDDEVLLKIMAVGVCGSDIPRINHKGPHVLPVIPGHEFAGEVIEVGKEVTGWEVSDRAAVAPLIPCNQCEWCEQGLYSLCEDYKYYGSRNDGAFAEYLAVKAENLLKLNKTTPFDWGATVDPAANAIHAFFRGDIGKEDTLTVFGMGAIGLFAIQYAKAIGITKIIAVDINTEKLETAKSCGADYLINSGNESVIEKIKEYTNGDGTTAVLEMSGAAIAQVQAVQAAAKMGRIVYLGINNGNLDIPNDAINKILRGQLSIIGSWNSFSNPFPGKEWTESVRLMEEGKLNPGKLITHRLGLDDVPEVFRKIDKEPFHFNKIMFYPHGE